MFRHCLILLLFLFSFLALGSERVSLLPEQNLKIGLGFEFLKSSSNYDGGGSSSPLLTGNVASTYSRNRFVLEGSYGIARDWDFLLQTNILSSQITQDGASVTTYSGNGLGDILTSVRWRFLENDPALVLEVDFEFPFYSLSNLEADELAMGDGYFNTHVRLMGVYGTKQVLGFFVPGIKLRTGGYSSAFTLGAGVETRMSSFYGQLFSHLNLSLSDNFPATAASVDSSQNQFSGSGGTYQVLSLSPNQFEMGIKLGNRFGRYFNGDILLGKTLFGSRAANAFRVGLQLSYRFDFYEEEKRVKTKEVPLDGDPNPQF